jgi:hypothetical protein
MSGLPKADQVQGPERRKPRGPSRQGLVEYLLVTGFLLVAAAGAVAIFGDELRDVFGVRNQASDLRPQTSGVTPRPEPR